MRDYKELLGLVAKVESDAGKPVVTYVMMDPGEGEPITMPSQKGYATLISEMSSVDKNSKPAMQRQMKAQKRQQRQPKPPKELKAEIEKPKAVAKKWSMPPLFAAKPKPVEKPKPIEQTASDELDKVVKKADVEKAEKMQTYTMPPKDLVLPTLSVTDQVMELDKIIASLKGGSLDADQMKIVKDEVRGLSGYLASAKVKESEGSLNGDLARMRRLRIDEALNLIGGS